MQTIKITVELSIWCISHQESEVIEVEVRDDATPAQIEEAKHQAAREWVYEKVSWSYRDPEPSDYED